MKIAGICLFFLGCSVAVAQKTGYAGYSEATVKALQQEIINLGGQTDLAHASLGFCVYAPDSNMIIASYNPELALTPASTMKLVTTAAALGILGVYFKFSTALEYSGMFDTITGVIHGNLYVKGGGDPTLGSERAGEHFGNTIESWVNVLKEKGVKEITGNIIADQDIFDDQFIPVHWIWGDIGNYYGAGSTGLCFNENSFAAYFNSGKEKGDSVKLVKTVPDMKEYNIFNFVTTGPKYSGDKSWFASSPWGNDIFMYGKIGAAEKDFEVEGTIPDPPLLCVSLFRDSLSACGIRVGGQHTTSRLMRRKGIAMDSVRTEMHAWNSKALISIVYMTNKSSVNLYAETMIRMIGVKQRGSGNVSSGTDAVESYWKGKKIDMKGFRMYDGSGLSKHNTVTPLQFCQTLDAIQSEKYYKAFYESLPVAGKSGTLASMCKGTSADGKVVAKSGYMSNVRCYAGYVTTQKGSIVTFAIMANNFDCSASAMKKKIEKIFVKMADLSR